jgi:hypothetical protein
MTRWRIKSTGFDRRASEILLEDVESDVAPTLEQAAQLLLKKAHIPGTPIPSVPRGASIVERLLAYEFDEPSVERLDEA